jgi:hypothetical protein
VYATPFIKSISDVPFSALPLRYILQPPLFNNIVYIVEILLGLKFKWDTVPQALTFKNFKSSNHITIIGFKSFIRVCK